MVITFEFDYDVENDALTNVTLTQSKAANQLGITANHIGTPWDNTSVAGYGKGRLNDFNGFPMKNIGWDLYIMGAHSGGSNVGEKIGVELTFDNGDVLDVWYRNNRWEFTYTPDIPSQQQCATGLVHAAPWSENQAIKITSAISGSNRIFTFYETDNNSIGNDYPPVNPNWQVFGADPFFTVTNGKPNYIVDMKIHAQTTNIGSSGGTPVTVLHTVHFETTQGLFINEPIGFDPSIIIQSYILRNSMGLGGNASFVVNTQRLSSPTPTVLKAQKKKSITFQNAFGINSWQGEVSELEFLGIYAAELKGEEILRKLKYTPVDANPVELELDIRYNEGLLVTDRDALFITSGINSTMVAAFDKPDLKVMAMRPDSALVEFNKVSDDTSYAGSTEEGDTSLLYFFDDSLPEDEAGLLSYEDPASTQYYVSQGTNMYTKFGNTWEKLVIKISLAFPNEISGDISSIRMFNDRTSAWEKLDDLSRGGGDNTSAFVGNITYTDPKEIEYDVAQQLMKENSYNAYSGATTYADNDRVIYNTRLWTSIQGANLNNTPAVGSAFWQLTINDFRIEQSSAASSDEFTHDVIRWHIRVPTQSGDSALWLWEALMTVTFKNNNLPEFSSCGITTVTEGILTLTALAGPINLPEEDGFGVGDKIIISKSAKDFLEDNWVASDLQTNLGGLDFDVTGADSLALLNDYTNRSYWALMSHIDDILNSAVWRDYTNTTIVQRSADNLVSTGITITRFDLVGWNDRNPPWEYSLKAGSQRTKARVTGSKDTSEIDIVTDDTFDLGDEWELINDNTLKTKKEVDDAVDALEPKHKTSNEELKLPIDFTNPHQSYATVEVGKTIAVQLPTGSDRTLCDYSSGGTDGEEMKITDRETVVNKDGIEITYITVQKRNI